MTNNILRFYLSSTFRDLRDEREIVARNLVDLEVLPVQTLVASPDPVLKACLKDLERCDAVILLVASNYGTIITDRKGSLSITHREFLHAERKKIPVLAFELTYVPPLDPAKQDQRTMLDAFKREYGCLKRLVAPVESKHQLSEKVILAVEKYLRERQAKNLSVNIAPSGFSVPVPSDSDDSFYQKKRPDKILEMYLQVQLKPRADCFDLIPEVFLPQLGDATWMRFPDGNPDPCQGVPINKITEVLVELSVQAQCNVPENWVTRIKLLVLELLLPDEILVELLATRYNQSSIANGLRQAFAQLTQQRTPFLFRTMQRANLHHWEPVAANRLHDHWNYAHSPKSSLLACSCWPEAAATANMTETTTFFYNDLQLKDPDKYGAVSALVGLHACPADLFHTGELLKSILASPLPVVLLWSAAAADDSTNLASRWEQATTLLNRSLPKLPADALVVDGAPGHRLHGFVMAPLGWCSRAAAEQRQSLLGNKQPWVDHVMLLIDCPERWPARITPGRPSAIDRYQVRRSSTN